MAGLIKTYGIFAAGYLMRPLGGVVFGFIGDKYGRKKALQLSIFMMAIPTVLLGCLPTHEQLGITIHPPLYPASSPAGYIGGWGMGRIRILSGGDRSAGKKGVAGQLDPVQRHWRDTDRVTCCDPYE